MANFTRSGDNVVIAIRPDAVQYVEPIVVAGVAPFPGAPVMPATTDSRIFFKSGGSVVVKEEFSQVAQTLT